MSQVLDLSVFARELKVKFFISSPPPHVRYPYIVIHTGPAEERGGRKRSRGQSSEIVSLSELERVAERFSYADLIMVDVRVHRFRDEPDYPKGFVLAYGEATARLAEKLRDKLIITLCDLPYDPKYFHGVQYPDNVRKTLRYHLHLLKWLEQVCRKTGSKLMLVVQHRVNKYVREEKSRKPFRTLPREAELDLRKSCVLVEEILGYLKDESVVYGIAVGSLCVNKKPTLIALIVNYVGEYFRKWPIHGFGVHVGCIQYLSEDVRSRFSIDSTGWTRPGSLGQHMIGAYVRYSCKTMVERTVFLICELASVARYCGQESLYYELVDLAFDFAVRNGLVPRPRAVLEVVRGLIREAQALIK